MRSSNDTSQSMEYFSASRAAALYGAAGIDFGKAADIATKFILQSSQGCAGETGAAVVSGGDEGVVILGKTISADKGRGCPCSKGDDRLDAVFRQYLGKGTETRTATAAADESDFAALSGEGIAISKRGEHLHRVARLKGCHQLRTLADNTVNKGETVREHFGRSKGTAQKRIGCSTGECYLEKLTWLERVRKFRAVEAHAPKPAGNTPVFHNLASQVEFSLVAWLVGAFGGEEFLFKIQRFRHDEAVDPGKPFQRHGAVGKGRKCEKNLLFAPWVVKREGLFLLGKGDPLRRLRALIKQPDNLFIQTVDIFPEVVERQ